jgi:plastocyanin
MRPHRMPVFAVVVLATLGLPVPLLGRAEDDAYHLTIKDHRFEPPSLEVPAGKRVKLLVRNLDPTAEEFDSDDLHREKVIAAGQEGTIFIGPLQRGTYRFIGEFHQATAKGQIVAK